MSLSGLTGSPSGCCFQIPNRSRGLLCRRVSAIPGAEKPTGKVEFPHHQRAASALKLKTRQTNLIRCAMGASFGDMTNEPTGSEIFPRINIKDPYRRLGISEEASGDEIQAARNFLISKYGWHKPSAEAIEKAHNKIIMQKFHEKRNPKIDIKKKVRDVKQSWFIQAVTGMFKAPATKFILKSSLAFIALGVLTVLFPTEDGPTVQVLLSLIATIYLIHERLKKKFRALVYGIGAFFFSWFLGTFLVISVIPPIIKGLRGFEVLTSLVTYFLLWIASTYLQ